MRPDARTADEARGEPPDDVTRMFGALIRELPLAIVVLDRDGRPMIWNPAAEQVLGWRSGDVFISPLASIPDDYRRDAVLVNQATLEGESFAGIEVPMRHRDGSLIRVVLSTAPFYDGRGRIQGTTNILIDVSEQRRATETLGFLASAGAELTRSLEVTPILESLATVALPVLGDFVAVDLFEENGEVHRVATRHVDPAKDEIVQGLRPYAAFENRMRVRASEGRWRQPEVLSDVSDSWLVRNAEDAEHLLLLRRLAPHSVMVLPLVMRDRALGSITLALTRPGRRYDLRDLELAEEVARRAATAVENARLYEETQHAVRARDDVLAIVSHDLRNPIHTISMAADLLRERLSGDEESARQIDIISRTARRMEHLIRDLLDVARIEAGGVRIQPTEQDPAELVREAVQFQQPQARERSIRLVGEAPEAMPPIRADRERLLQVFQNLIDNALRFTPEGGEVTVRAVAGPDEVRFSVRDTGTGIEQDQLEHLFEPFWQAEKAAQGGAGLGLAIARGIVEAHGGEISAESTPGGGTTISFTIPLE